MIDVGGSMYPYSQLMSQLFSAAKEATHFKELRTYYFHNRIYGRVYETDRFTDPKCIHDVIRECDGKYKLSIDEIARAIDMYPLTVDGLTEAMTALNKGTPARR